MIDIEMTKSNFHNLSGAELEDLRCLLEAIIRSETAKLSQVPDSGLQRSFLEKVKNLHRRIFGDSAFYKLMGDLAT